MSLNAGGVGITFEGEDRGFLGLVSNAGEQLKKLSVSAADSLGGVNEQFSKMGDHVGQGLRGTGDVLMGFVRGAGKGLGKLGFGFTVARMAFESFFGFLSPLIGGVKDLMGAFDPSALMQTVEQLGEVNNLTSSLEAEAVSTGQSARQMGAQMGYTGDQLEKFTQQATSMAMALNVGPDEAAKAIRGFDEASSEMKAIGLKNAAELAKFTSAFGVSADTLRNSTLMMRKEFGLTDAEIGNVIGATVEMGRATGDVPGALNEMSQHMERMREQARGMGVDLDGKKLANFAAQTNALAAGLFQMGQDSDTARAAAQELSAQLVSAEKDFRNMFAGTAQELPEFVKELAITTGDAESAFKLMESGPSGFVQGMASMVAQAKQQGTLTAKNLDFIGARMEKVLGAEAAARLVGFMRKADASTIRLMGNVEGATAQLGVMAKETFRTGRTMQEVFERMMMSVGDQFRKAGKKEVREWMRNVKEGVNVAKDKIGELAADKGPLGKFARKLAAAEHIGAQAFLPSSLQQGSIVLAHFSKQLSPVIDQMNQLGISFSIGGIIKGALVGIGLFASQVSLAKEKSEDWGSAIKRTANVIADDLVVSINEWGGLLPVIAKAFADFDWGSLFSGLSGAIDDKETGPIGKIVNAFKRIPWDDVRSNISEGWSKLWGAVEDSGIVDRLRSLFDSFVEGVLKPAMKSLVSVLVDDIPWNEIGTKIAKGMWEGIKSGTASIAKGSIMALFRTDEDAKREDKLKLLDVQIANDAEAIAKGREALNAARAANALSEQSFDMVADASRNALEDINDGWFDMFGNSMHTYVESDMKQVEEAFAYTADEFERVWNEAWQNVLEDFEIGVSAINTSASGVLSTLQNILQAKDAIAETRSGSETPAQATERDLRIRSAVGDQATHAPEWYRGSTGYEQLFTRKMDRLIVSVERMASAPSSQQAPSPAVAAKTQLADRRAARTGTGGVTTSSRSRSGGYTR